MKLKIDYKGIDKLIPYVNNSRTHSDEQINQIAASIQEFGFTNPVLLDGDNGIIAGHGRLMAAKKLELEEVPTIELKGLSETQKKAYIIADNKLALNANWDDEILALELEELQELDFDIDLLGFDEEELSLLLEPEQVEGLTDEDAVPDAPEIPKSVKGDVWLLEQHRVMCGDSTSIDDVENLMGGGLADQLVTDPPYNVDYKGGEGDSLTIQNDDMSDGDFRRFLVDAFVAADTFMKQGAVFYIWHSDMEGYNFRGACHDAGWVVRQSLIWNKNSMVLGWQDYHSKHEPCLYGWKDGAGHLWNTDRKQVTILDFNKPIKNGVHPTMKPVDLISYQVLNNTKGQDVVLDLFGGSGTTLIACEKNNRHARLMELDEKYVDVIINRWQEYTGKKAIHAETSKEFDEI